MNWRNICGRLSAVCVVLIAVSGCRDESAKPITHVQDSGQTKAEVDSQPAKSETPAANQKEVGENDQQVVENDADAVEIPLNQIWALHTPDTRDILQLDPDGDYNSLLKLPREEVVQRWKDSPTRQISEALMGLNGATYPKEGEEARPGFAVAGTGVEALREARAVMVDGKSPDSAFRSGTDVTVVFFAYCREGPIQLMRASRTETRITVDYRFIVPLEKNLTDDLALIPLGALPAGKYHVEIRRLLMGKETRDRTYVSYGADVPESARTKAAELRFVCRPFSFDVVEAEAK